jgi:hypothetical protein
MRMRRSQASEVVREAWVLIRHLSSSFDVIAYKSLLQTFSSWNTRIFREGLHKGSEPRIWSSQPAYIINLTCSRREPSKAEMRLLCYWPILMYWRLLWTEEHTLETRVCEDWGELNPLQ